MNAYTKRDRGDRRNRHEDRHHVVMVAYRVEELRGRAADAHAQAERDTDAVPMRRGQILLAKHDEYAGRKRHAESKNGNREEPTACVACAYAPSATIAANTAMIAIERRTIAASA